MATTLKQRVFSGVFWMAAMSGSQQILGFFVQIALARLLIPKDYGVVALVMTIGSFAVVLSAAGIATALVQREELPRAIIDAAAVITGCVAICLGGVIFFCSPLIASFYKLPEMVFLLRLVAIDVFLKVMISLYDALLLRAMRYRVLSVGTFCSLLIQSGVSIAMACLGFGPKSLVVGYLCGSASLLVIFMMATRYLPHTRGDFREVKGVFQFGGWILLGRIANQAAFVLDQLVITRVLNVFSLGLIDVSKKLTGILPNTFLGFAGRVSLPVFSQWQHDYRRIEGVYWRGLRLNMMVVFPVCAMIALFSYQILALLYGAKWLEGNMLMKIFALQVALVSIDAGYSSSVINGTGNPRYGTIVMIVSLFLIPGFVYLGSFWGMSGVAWGMVAYGGIFFIINQLVLRHVCHFSLSRFPLDLIRAILAVLPVLAVGILIVCSGLLPSSSPPLLFSMNWFQLLFRLLGSVIVCLVVYVISVCFFMREDVLFLYNGIFSLLRRRS